MADTKISALTAVVTAAASDEYVVNQAGTTKKVTLAQALTSPTILGAAKFDDAANATLIEIDNDGTGHGIHLHQDGVLGEGKYALYIHNPSGTVQTSRLVRFTNDDEASTGTVLRIDNQGTGTGLIVVQPGVLAATKHALHVTSAGNQVNSSIALIAQTASASQPVLEIDNDGIGHGLYLHQDGVLEADKYGLYIYTNAAQINSPLMHIHSDNTNSTVNLALFTNDGTGHGINIRQVGKLAATQNALRVSSATIGQTNSPLVYFVDNHADSTEPIVKIVQDHASASGDGIQIQNDGTGNGLLIDQNGNGTSLNIDSEATTANVIAMSNAGTGYGISIVQNGNGMPLNINNLGTNTGLSIATDGLLAANKASLYINANTGQTNSPIVHFRNNHDDTTTKILYIEQSKAASSADAVEIKNAGTGNGILIDQNGNGTSLNIDSEATTADVATMTNAGTGVSLNIANAGNGSHFRLTGDPTVASPVDGDIWFDGTNLKMRIGETTYNIDMTGE